VRDAIVAGRLKPGTHRPRHLRRARSRSSTTTSPRCWSRTGRRTP